jgi:hypothetical protein
MEKQEPKKKTRVPVQFYVEAEDKERADAVASHYGEISHMARTGFLTEVEKRERQKLQDEKLAS